MTLATLVLLPALLLAPPASACQGCEAHAATADAAPDPAVPAQPSQPPKSFAERPAVGTQAFCPVMEEAFRVEEDTRMEQHEGRWYAFCCAPCAGKFKADPERYAD